MQALPFLALLLALTVGPLFGVPSLFRLVTFAIGQTLRSRTRKRRDLLFERAADEEADVQTGHSGLQERGTATTSSDDGEWEKIEPSGMKLPSSGNGTLDDSWAGVVGFFHPFCNAGGGGERVLWAAIRATQEQYPRALCVVYTGDHDADRSAILHTVSSRFNIHLHAPRVVFLYLSTRHWVLPATWPRFTLLGQSFGSLFMAWDALSLMVPDVFIDTMGYAFSLACVKALLPTVPTAAYVHYPTISRDMLGSLDDRSGHKGVNAGLGSGPRGKAKRAYWELFALLYSWAGGSVDVVMTNSSWTQGHITYLWEPSRQRRQQRKAGTGPDPIEVVFPPVAVEELEEAIPVDEASEAKRRPHLLYISQFRPEKNHELIITAFSEFVRAHGLRKPSVVGDNNANGGDNDGGDDDLPELILAGSVRDDADKMLVYNLRLLAREAGVAAQVRFVVNAPWSTLLALLRTSSVGVNGMWNEHFGIGVVEYQAAGLISVVNDSGGPRMDIVVDDVESGRPTGFHASTEQQYADAFAAALALGRDERVAMRLGARRSAGRFTEGQFRTKWRRAMGTLVGLSREGASGKARA